MTGADQRPDSVLDGFCWCACGTWIGHRRRTTRFVNEKHKKRYHRRRLQHAARAAGLPANLSFQAIEQAQAGKSTGKRPGDAPRRRKPDLRVSYRKALAAVADGLRQVGIPEGQEHNAARLMLEPLLSDRQRKSLR